MSRARALACPSCGGPVSQDYAAKFRSVQVRGRVGWGEFTHYDLVPKDVRGAGPQSEAFRRFSHVVEDVHPNGTVSNARAFEGLE